MSRIKKIKLIIKNFKPLDLNRYKKIFSYIFKVVVG